MPSGLVAQLVEQSPEKACVAGSIPAQTTIFYLQFHSHVDNQPLIEMIKKYILICYIILLASCAKSQNMKNPDNICKDCGSFDLAKLSFNENVAILISKTEVWKTAIVNANNEEKEIENLLKSDTIILYKYHFSNQQNKILDFHNFHF